LDFRVEAKLVEALFGAFELLKVVDVRIHFAGGEVFVLAVSSDTQIISKNVHSLNSQQKNKQTNKQTKKQTKRTTNQPNKPNQALASTTHLVHRQETHLDSLLLCRAEQQTIKDVIVALIRFLLHNTALLQEIPAEVSKHSTRSINRNYNNNRTN
jgi:uncharacterized membrane protein YdbT with pleckstrin-like domain